MDNIADAGSGKDNGVPPGPAVRKGRRGLAKKKTAPSSNNLPSVSTYHETSIYSSCVSRGSMFGGIGLAQDESEVNAKDDNKSHEIKDNQGSTEMTPTKIIAEFSDERKETEEIRWEDEEITTPSASVSGPSSFRSPTPPPTSEGPTKPKKRRMNKKLSSALKTLNMAKGNLNTPISRALRSRRKRSKDTCPHTDIYTDTIPPEDLLPVAKNDMVVKVRYLSNIHRLQLKLTDQFHRILSHLSRETGQEEQYLSLYLHDQALPLSKTPKEVNLTVADIIECHCMKDMKGSDVGDKSISLLIQCSNIKRKTEINVTMRQQFSEILESYSKQAGIAALSYSLCFDGDDVNPKDTPLSLEMEDGDILDLIPAVKPGAKNRSAWQNSVITII